MATYLLFSFYYYYPSGGMSDFVGWRNFATNEEAITWAKSQIDKSFTRDTVELSVLTDDGSYETVLWGERAIGQKVVKWS